MLTPLDIHNREFKKGFRGYSEVEVDEFLDQVVKDFEEVLRSNAELKSRIEELGTKVQQYRSLEETLNNTLIVAQRTADEVKSAAHHEANIIVEKAKLEGARALDEARARVRTVEEELASLRRQVNAFRSRARAMLQSYEDLLDLPDDEIEDTKAL